jgi:hypothetical protein
MYILKRLLQSLRSPKINFFCFFDFLPSVTLSKIKILPRPNTIAPQMFPGRMTIDGGGWQMCYTTNGIVSDDFCLNFNSLVLYYYPIVSYATQGTMSHFNP